MAERQPIPNVKQPKEPGIVRRGLGKGMDVAAGVSKFTIVPFAAVWGASVVFPGAVPGSLGAVAKWGAITDAGTLVVDKFRNKEKGSSFPKQGNIFIRSVKRVGGGLWAVPRDTFRQVKPTRSAFGY